MALERLTLPAPLLAHIQRRRLLEDTLRHALPEELGSHVFLLNVRGDTLVLGCDIQALITPLRFQAPKLLAAAATILGEEKCPRRVAWRTLPPPPAKGSPLQPRYPSAEVIEGIEAAARCIDDRKLSQALQRLVRTLHKKKSEVKGNTE